MTTRFVEEHLKELLETESATMAAEFVGPKWISKVQTYGPACLLLKMSDGSEYQLTIVQKKRSEYDEE